MKPEFKAFVQQAVRFFRRIGFNLPGALATVTGLYLMVTALLSTITYFVTGSLIKAGLDIYNESAGTSVGAWAPEMFGWIAALAVFFLMTVGIILTIDELRGWVIKFLLIGLTCGILGSFYKTMLPVATSAGPLAEACLASLLLCVGAVIIAHLFGQGDSVKILSGWLPVGLGIILFITLLGFHGCKEKKAPPPPEEPKEIVLTAADPYRDVELQPGQASLIVTAPKSKTFDPIPPNDSCTTKIVVNKKGPQRNLCPWPDNIRTVGYVRKDERVTSYQAIAGKEPVTVRFNSTW